MNMPHTHSASVLTSSWHYH